MTFRHNEVNFKVKYEDHQKCSKSYFLKFLKVFSDHHVWHQNWPQGVWTSLCQVKFFMNLIHSQHLWLCDIWHTFYSPPTTYPHYPIHAICLTPCHIPPPLPHVPYPATYPHYPIPATWVPLLPYAPSLVTPSALVICPYPYHIAPTPCQKPPPLSHGLWQAEVV